MIDFNYSKWFAFKAAFVGPRVPALVPDEDHPQHVTLKIDEHDFGVRDSKGRKIGCDIRTATRVYKRIESGNHEGGMLDRRFDVGVVYYLWLGQATRAGRGFGAGQSFHYCLSDAERQDGITKYLSGARARALKQFAAPV